MTHPPLSFLHANASHPQWRTALAECLRQLHAKQAEQAAQRHAAEPATLGWCYLSDRHAASAEAILAELQRALPGVAWVGTTGIGVSAGGIEYFDQPGIVLMLAPLKPGSFRLFSGRQPLPTAGDGFDAHCALVHAEGSTPDVQELLHDLSGYTATGYLFGGLASSRHRSFHLADGVFTGGLSGVLFGPEVGLVSRVTQGCQPIGPTRTITHADDNFVLTLDGMPALDCALQDLGLDAATDGSVIAKALSATLVGLRSDGDDLLQAYGRFGADTLVRHLIGVDVKHRVLAVAERVESGMQLTFCRRDREAARSDLLRITAEIRDEVDTGRAGPIAGALYVSCSGRGGPHFGAPNAELETVRAGLGDVPLVGFFAGGEIARNHLYGYTGVLTVFTAGH
jgi:small ligand-binding sensory domain FIST